MDREGELEMLSMVDYWGWEARLRESEKVKLLVVLLSENSCNQDSLELLLNVRW